MTELERLEDSQRLYSIGEVSGFLSMGIDAIRHYEKWGLVTPAKKLDNGYRYYSGREIVRLLCLKYARDMDMSIAEIQDSLQQYLWEDYSAFLNGKLEELERERKRLEQMERDLQGMIALGNRINEGIGVIREVVLPSVYRLPVMDAGVKAGRGRQGERNTWFENMTSKRMILLLDTDTVFREEEGALPVELRISVSASEVERAGVELNAGAEFEDGGRGLQFCLRTPDVFALTRRDLAPILSHIREKGYRTYRWFTGQIYTCEYLQGQPRYLVAVRMKILD